MNKFRCPPYVGGVVADGQFLSTAFVCAMPRLVVTCAHTIANSAAEFSWRLGDGDVVPLPYAKVVFFNEGLDIAIIDTLDPIINAADVADLPRQVYSRRVPVQFDAISEYREGNTVLYPLDSGEGHLVGEHVRAEWKRGKLKSTEVTPGCSGAPILYDSHLGLTVVGMISARYNSADEWNSGTVWVVLAEDLASAVTQARDTIQVDGLLRLAGGIDGVPPVFMAELRQALTHRGVDRFVDQRFESNAGADDFIRGASGSKSAPEAPEEPQDPEE
jgi:hypothetical protein